MEIIILLTILLAFVLLGGSLLQGGKRHLFGSKLMTTPPTAKNNLLKSLFGWAVKLEEKCLHLLNTVATLNNQKRAQTIFIYSKIHTFLG
ncbi:hypothetical protein [Falsiporphyromonas endometrii]|uniref:ATP synthase F0 subunit 8 n=1 Tax=Falsiporphyromonas endometrii TaxID=1387297 RepID=A0ABV9K4Z8_9PORP